MNAVDFTEHSRTKGGALFDAGRVTLRGEREAFVQGDHGIYLVRFFAKGQTCTCPARGGGCSHIVAALLAWGEAMRADQPSPSAVGHEEGDHVSDSH